MVAKLDVTRQGPISGIADIKSKTCMLIAWHWFSLCLQTARMSYSLFNLAQFFLVNSMWGDALTTISVGEAGGETPWSGSIGRRKGERKKRGMAGVRRGLNASEWGKRVVAIGRK